MPPLEGGARQCSGRASNPHPRLVVGNSYPVELPGVLPKPPHGQALRRSPFAGFPICRAGTTMSHTYSCPECGGDRDALLTSVAPSASVTMRQPRPGKPCTCTHNSRTSGAFGEMLGPSRNDACPTPRTAARRRAARAGRGARGARRDRAGVPIPYSGQGRPSTINSGTSPSYSPPVP